MSIPVEYGKYNLIGKRELSFTKADRFKEKSPK